MNNCGNTKKSTCGARKNSACIDYDGILSEQTEITSQCVDVEQVLVDVTTLIDKLFSESDLTELENGCITLPTTLNVKNLFQTIITFMCEQQTTITEQATSITEMQAQIVDLQTGTCPPEE